MKNLGVVIMQLILSVVVVCVLVAVTDGYCLGAPSDIDDTTKEVTCNYEGYKMVIGEKRLFLNTCMSCKCSLRGLSCCARGLRAGTWKIPMPKNCKMIDCLCQARIVRKDNPTLHCITGKTIDVCEQEHGVSSSGDR